MICSLCRNAVRCKQMLDHCHLWRRTMVGSKFSWYTTLYCTSQPSYFQLFFNPILHIYFAVNTKLNSIPSGLISVKHFVIFLLSVHDKLYDKNFLKAFGAPACAIVNIPLLSQGRGTLRECSPKALFHSVPNAQSSANFIWISDDLKPVTNLIPIWSCSHVTPWICNSTGWR